MALTFGLISFPESTHVVDEDAPVLASILQIQLIGGIILQAISLWLISASAQLCGARMLVLQHLIVKSILICLIILSTTTPQSNGLLPLFEPVWLS